MWCRSVRSLLCHLFGFFFRERSIDMIGEWVTVVRAGERWYGQLSGPYHTHLNLHCNVHPHALTASSIATGWLESRERHQSPHQLPIVGAALVLALGLDPTSNHACICAVPSPAVECKSTRTRTVAEYVATLRTHVNLVQIRTPAIRRYSDRRRPVARNNWVVGSGLRWCTSCRMRGLLLVGGRWRQSCNAARKARGRVYHASRKRIGRPVSTKILTSSQRKSCALHQAIMRGGTLGPFVHRPLGLLHWVADSTEYLLRAAFCY